MAYEYEEYIKNVIGTEAVFSHEKEKRQERVKELQEVYQKARLLDDIVITTKKRLTEQERKAQAFDKILNLPDTYGYAEDYAEDVDIILSEYMEDE